MFVIMLITNIAQDCSKESLHGDWGSEPTNLTDCNTAVVAIDIVNECQ